MSTRPNSSPVLRFFPIILLASACLLALPAPARAQTALTPPSVVDQASATPDTGPGQQDPSAGPSDGSWAAAALGIGLATASVLILEHQAGSGSGQPSITEQPLGQGAGPRTVGGAGTVGGGAGTVWIGSSPDQGVGLRQDHHQLPSPNTPVAPESPSLFLVLGMAAALTLTAPLSLRRRLRSS